MKSKKRILAVSVLYLAIMVSYIFLKYILDVRFHLNLKVRGVCGYFYLYLIVMPILIVTSKNKKFSAEQKKMGHIEFVFIFCQQTMLAIIALNLGRCIEHIFGNLHNSVSIELSIYNLIVLLLVAPVCEEFFFRKIFIDKCNFKGGNYRLVIIANAIIFAIPHYFSQGLAQVFYTSVLGAIWSYIYIKYNNIRYCIMLHFGSNLFMLAITVLDVYGVCMDRCLCILLVIVAIIGVFSNNGKKFNIKL